MQYKLTVRELTSNDINKYCPFTPEKEDLEMHLDSLMEDINIINHVSDVIRKGLIIEFRASVELKNMRHLIKPFFTDNRSCEYRYVSLESIT